MELETLMQSSLPTELAVSDFNYRYSFQDPSNPQGAAVPTELFAYAGIATGFGNGQNIPGSEASK
jgi:hypothetical protein